MNANIPGLINGQLKMCTRCKRMIPLKGKSYCDECTKERNKENKQQSKTQAIYNDVRYRKARDQVMRQANGLCEVCLCYDRRTLAKETHHIVSVMEGNEETHFSPDNLIACCYSCHKKIEGMSKEEIIRALESGELC